MLTVTPVLEPSSDLQSGKSMGGTPTPSIPQKLARGEGFQIGSPVVDSRQSPQNDIEDEEEDLLYLRLMALRSIVPELAEMSKSSPENSDTESVNDAFENEMEELLDEVDQAADECEDSSKFISETNPINFASVVEKLKSSKKANDVPDDDVIIPSLEPDRSPIAIEEEDNEVVIVHEIAKPKTGLIKVSDFARIHPARSSNPVVIDVEDDVQIIEPDRKTSSNCEIVDMDLSVENEAEIQFFKDQADPEKQKDALFPPSVWQIGAMLTCPPPPPPPPLPSSSATSTSGTQPTMSDVLTFATDDERYDAFLKAVAAKPVRSETRKRRKSEESLRRSDDNVSGPSMLTKKMRKSVEKENENDEDPESLRANILISMIEERKRKEKNTLKKKPTFASPSSSKLSTTTKQNSELQKLKDDVGVQMRHFPNLFKKVIVSTTIAAPSDDDEGEELKQNVSPDFNKNLDIFLKNVRQQTSESKKKATPPPKPARKNPPGRGLASVGRAATAARSSVPIAAKQQTALPQVRKQVVAVAASNGSSKRTLSTKVKSDLMTSNVSHLPAEKQAEYKKLIELIAQKERDKALKKKQPQHQPAPVKQTKQQNLKVPATADPEEEEEDADILRSKLLASMEVKKKQGVAQSTNQKSTLKIDSKSPKDNAATLLKDNAATLLKENAAAIAMASPVEATSTQIPPRKRVTGPGLNIPVLMKRKIVPEKADPVKASKAVPVASRKVAQPTVPKETQAENEVSVELKKKEEELSNVQRDMTQDIFKLSAQVSQLKQESKNLEAATSFAADLRRQLAETEAIVERNVARIFHLKTKIGSDLVDMVSQKSVMTKIEEECRTKGQELHGPMYKLPQAPERERIKKKLALIKSNADTLLQTKGDNEMSIKYLENKSQTSDITTTTEEAAVTNVSTEEEAAVANVVTSEEVAVTNVATAEEDAVANVATAEELSVTNAATAEEAPVTNSTINSDTVSITASPKPDLHTSSLAHLRPGQIQVLDPHTQLCRFELLGKCNDDQCPFQHYSPKERQNSDISKL